MEIVVIGRQVEVSDRFRRHVEEKLAKVGQLAPEAQRIDVELTHERNPRLAETSERVELTVRIKGRVVRAEASADDEYAALDSSTTKLLERLRRARDRRKDHHRGMPLTPVDVRPLEPTPEPVVEPVAALGEAVEKPWGDGDSPVVIREKLHEAHPMTLDDALYEMEMVGHDFYLFIDAETALPSVAYRRRGWSYGVIRLDAPVNATVDAL
ncbi:ribosome hibernation-promoting factor, HPF/YfiA family [Actinotalea sp. K2]|uniref:ribosome hibernation-promoting factor, HPF/YfiA family n=1 Tax=Actinotalea sp. K2 TaxID=2939438 RepID=UPI002017080C|nr:ribosome-associated translation inhibitor RaiA [Actinotalea sp. K2]MCL3862667.1 ribosome-associated translation inhibitor RaiA [Actinotalea sp. K2]